MGDAMKIRDNIYNSPMSKIPVHIMPKNSKVHRNENTEIPNIVKMAPTAKDAMSMSSLKSSAS